MLSSMCRYDNNTRRPDQKAFGLEFDAERPEEGAEATFPALATKEPIEFSPCRICMSEEIDSLDDPLINPCNCKGYMAYVHLKCLRHWLTTNRHRKSSGNTGSKLYCFKKTFCEICQTVYPNAVEIDGNLHGIYEFDQVEPPYVIFETLYRKDKNKLVFVVPINGKENIRIVSLFS